MNLPFKELILMMNGMARGYYPNFVLRKGYEAPVPIFFYHQVDYEEFSRHLSYLRNNGYETLTAEEYYYAINANQLGSRAVVLTFDDGLSDLYTTIYPLLKKYGFKATAFIIPELVGKEFNINWSQALEMHRSGVIDFQSHSMRHAAVFISDKLVDFYHPGYKSIYPWNLPLTRRNNSDRYLDNTDLGTPIFEFASCLTDNLRYFSEQLLVTACLEVVREGGYDHFFKTKHWRKKLIEVFQRHQGENARGGWYETTKEKRRFIAMELICSKQNIEENLPGKTVHHFAFPWSQTGKVAGQLLSDCGYKSAYVGLPTKRLLNSSLKDFGLINRVNGDFVLRLPGNNRRSLMWIIQSKIRKRLLGKHMQ
jgi:hypothetical protein